MGGPSVPDPNVAAVQGQTASVENYPYEYLINQLSQLGQSGTINGQTYDFTGLGNASQAAAMSGQSAQGQLALQQQYGPEFIQQALAQLQQENPQGTVAENQLGQLATAPVPGPSATSQQLEQNVMGQIGNAGALTTGPASETEQVQQAVRGQQLANGITMGNAPAAQEADALEQAGANQRQQIQGATEQYLGAGVSPEDVQYRQIQQQLSNLGGFWSGQTPLAEFSSIGAAQNGAAPSGTNYSNGAQINTGGALTGLQQAEQEYGSEVGYQATQMNGLAALGGVGVAGMTAAGAAGWNPYLSNAAQALPTGADLAPGSYVGDVPSGTPGATANIG